MSVSRLATTAQSVSATNVKADNVVGGQVFQSPTSSAYAGVGHNADGLNLVTGDNRYIALPGGNQPGAIWGWWNSIPAFQNDGVRIGYNINPAAPNCTRTDAADGAYVNVGYGSVTVGFIPRTNSNDAGTVETVGTFNSTGFRGILSSNVTLDGAGAATVSNAALTAASVVVAASRGSTAVSVIDKTTGSFGLAGGASEVVDQVVLHL